MAHDKIKLNYEQAEAMAKTFKEGSTQLQQTMQEMQKLMEMLREGALLGRGGDEFANALKDNLCPSIKRMAEKFTELEGDVRSAISSMRQADAESKQQFR